MQFHVIRLKHTVEQETPFHVNVQPTLNIAKLKTKTTDIQNKQHQTLDVIYKTDVTDVKQHTV